MITFLTWYPGGDLGDVSSQDSETHPVRIPRCLRRTAVVVVIPNSMLRADLCAVR
jgi:hypothetical protein